VLGGDDTVGLDGMMGDGPGADAAEGIETSFGSSVAACGTGAGRGSTTGSALGGGGGSRFRTWGRLGCARWRFRRLANFSRHLDHLNVDRPQHRRIVRGLLEQRQETHL
jgi:hypothetical protein